jgi:hypothetical protein
LNKQTSVWGSIGSTIVCGQVFFIISQYFLFKKMKDGKMPFHRNPLKPNLTPIAILNHLRGDETSSPGVFR